MGYRPAPLRASGGWYSTAGPVILSLTMVVLGAKHLGRRRGAAELILFVGPLALVTIAAITGLFPFGARLLLFTAPLWIVLAVAGTEVILAWTGSALRPWARATIWFLALTMPAMYAILNALAPMGPQHTRPLVAAFDSLKTPREPVYVLAGALPAWVFYSTDWRNPDTAALSFHARIGTSGGVAFENAGPRSHPVRAEGEERQDHGHTIIYGVPSGAFRRSVRVYSHLELDSVWADHEAARIRARANPTAWVFLAHTLDPEMKLLESIEHAGGRAIDTLVQPGAVLLRYDFRTEPTQLP